MDNKEDNNTQNNQNEQTEEELQEQHNIDSNKRLAQTGLKGVATAAGAFFGGAAGAKIGSKAADIVNNTPVGNAITDAAGQVGNAANKMSPTGNINQGLANAAADSGALDLADKGIDAAASSGTNGTPSGSSGQVPQQNLVTPENPNIPKNQENKPTVVPRKNLPYNSKVNKTANVEVERPKSSNNRQNDKYNRMSKRYSSSVNENFSDESNDSDIENQDSNSDGNSKKKHHGKGDFLKSIKSTTSFLPAVAGVLGVVGQFIMSHITVISAFLIISVVISVFASLISLIGSMITYGQNDDGSLCYVSPTCTSVTLKINDDEKNVQLSEYIAGAIVKYYDYNDFKGADGNVNYELLKALAVIIHSDISAFSSYDYSNETCTVISSNKFTDIYFENSDNYSESDDNIGDSDDSLEQGDSTDNSDNNSEEDKSNDNVTDNNNSESSDDNDLYERYYNRAKNAATEVLSEVVDIYNSHFNLFYENYKNVLINAANLGYDYKKIIREYLKNDPNYTNVINESNDENDEKQDNNDIDGIGIYPICYFEQSNTGNGEISYFNNICSTVHINNGLNSGDYTIDTFIEGVVYNEARAWSDSLDTLKAHAVAARTYLVNKARVENGTCYIDVGSNTMGFTNNTNDAIQRAVTETSGEYIMVNGSISKEAEWDALCIKDLNTTSSNYTICQKNQQIPKSWFNEVHLFNSKEWYNEHSHGRGMSQYGAYYLATKQNKTYKDIISYYYGGNVGTVITQSKEGFVMPINTFSQITGEVTGYCGSGNPHSGMDFAAATGTPIYAAHDGIVVKVYDTNYNCYGKCSSTEGVGIGFRIDNQDGTVSMYMHMSSRENLPRGTTVKAGQLLGYVGNTGSSTGPHLHYGMSSSSTGATLNPRDYLPLDEKGYGRCYNYK